MSLTNILSIMQNDCIYNGANGVPVLIKGRKKEAIVQNIIDEKHFPYLMQDECFRRAFTNGIYQKVLNELFPDALKAMVNNLGEDQSRRLSTTTNEQGMQIETRSNAKVEEMPAYNEKINVYMPTETKADNTEIDTELDNEVDPLLGKYEGFSVISKKEGTKETYILESDLGATFEVSSKQIKDGVLSKKGQEEMDNADAELVERT